MSALSPAYILNLENQAHIEFMPNQTLGAVKMMQVHKKTLPNLLLPVVKAQP
jgi:hypothetical protein